MELARSGCLYLTLSGGEPFLRPDLFEMLSAARACGLLVTVQTNGSLVGEDEAEMLAAEPPRRIEVSVYGASEKTYRAVTGRAGMHDRVWRAVELLKSKGLNVRLNLVVMERLLRDLPEILRRARGIGVPVNADATVDRPLLGTGWTDTTRCDPAEAASAESASGRDHCRNTSNRSGRCLAGVQGFYVDAAGGLRPCAHLLEPRIDTTRTGFGAAWERLAGFVPPKLLYHPECSDCEARPWCSACPVMAEGTDEPSADSYYCRLAHARMRLAAAGGSAA